MREDEPVGKDGHEAIRDELGVSEGVLEGVFELAVSVAVAVELAIDDIDAATLLDGTTDGEATALCKAGALSVATTLTLAAEDAEGGVTVDAEAAADLWTWRLPSPS